MDGSTEITIIDWFVYSCYKCNSQFLNFLLTNKSNGYTYTRVKNLRDIMQKFSWELCRNLAGIYAEIFMQKQFAHKICRIMHKCAKTFYRIYQKSEVLFRVVYNFSAKNAVPATYVELCQIRHLIFTRDL